MVSSACGHCINSELRETIGGRSFSIVAVSRSPETLYNISQEKSHPNEANPTSERPAVDNSHEQRRPQSVENMILRWMDSLPHHPDEGFPLKTIFRNIDAPEGEIKYVFWLPVDLSLITIRPTILGPQSRIFYGASVCLRLRASHTLRATLVKSGHNASAGAGYRCGAGYR